MKISSLFCLDAVIKSLENSKAEDIVKIKLICGFLCDYMVIVSGRSDRHILSITDNLVSYLKDEGIKVFGVEGQQAANWIVVDVGDIVVHIFRPETRELYDLESLWKKALE
ncbi:Iojap protein [Liberibacter crescens BT-1]|uniref:Ribosomal silencing factor RsfS n=1 Tax=Liberibacter crescens (strain BT-1) TaxID=1215343 RepID=L0ES52_LIBCB|nr:ribosome silencing factor [Liberibacter crescens]AGA64329.1 Iojap protein [Liberibacter crescens BT-1]